MPRIIDFPQLEKMRAGVKYKEKIRCRDFEVEVRPLTNWETVKATAEAAEVWSKLDTKQQMYISSSLMNAIYQLSLAATSDVGVVDSKLPVALLEMLSPDEINHFWKQYVKMIDRVNPSFEAYKPEEIAATVEDLKKNSDPLSILNELSISQLVAVCRQLLATTT